MDNDKEAFITRLREALERAQQETAQLSLSIPSPLRDNFFHTLMQGLLGEEPHRTEHCQACMAIAHNMAVSALGWGDQNAARPATAQDRMKMLTEHVTFALRFLDKLHKEGLDAHD